MPISKNERNGSNSGPRLLYIVTSSKEFVQGKSRWLHTVLPVILESVKSLSEHGFRVDVFLVLGYKMDEKKVRLLEQSLPLGVGLEIWHDAQAIFKLRPHHERVKLVPKSLARQHRFVVKDKLFEYDVFAAMEDDMLIRGNHVAYYVNQTRRLQELWQVAPELGGTTDYATNGSINIDSTESNPLHQHQRQLSRKQIARLRPAFLRVEVLERDKKGGGSGGGGGVSTKNKKKNKNNINDDMEDSKSTHQDQTQIHLDPVPVADQSRVDPFPCCGRSVVDTNNQGPIEMPTVTVGTIKQQEPQERMDRIRYPPRSKTRDTTNTTRLMIWETSVAAMRVRYIPSIGWVALLDGPSGLSANEHIPGFTPPFEFDRKPESPTDPRFAAQSGGWIMTQRQIMEASLSHCKGGFLPPFDQSVFPYDALHGYMSTVEFFSGGMQLWQRPSGCNLQRYIVLDDFSKHLLYHTSDNKQHSIDMERRVKATDMYGQLLTLRDMAAAAETTSAVMG